MSTAAFKWLPAVLLVLGCHAPAAWAQSAPGAAEQLHANAVASFRQARFSEAYGRVMALADPDEVLVSATTHDLAEAADVAYQDRGSHELRGVTGARQVFSISPLAS